MGIDGKASKRKCASDWLTLTNSNYSGRKSMGDSDVTNEMLVAAVKQAVKDKILPKYGDMDTYTHHYECMQRIIKAALDAKKN